VGSFPIVSRLSSAPLLDLVASRHDVLISLDPNVRLAAEPDVSLWRKQVEAFRRAAHLIKVSEEDLAVLHGADADVEAIAGSWLGGRSSLVVLTRGERGCVLFSLRHDRIEVPAVETEVVDTVGAGDTCQAALLCWLDEAGHATPTHLQDLTQVQLRELGTFANRASAITCSRRGPDMPRRDELLKPKVNSRNE
jgi:fructokinase